MSGSLDITIKESLPRGRDGDFTKGEASTEQGITPARAGRSATTPQRRRLTRNHSRAGGTEGFSTELRTRSEESLPRGRDGVELALHTSDDPGITPARAGRSRRHRGTQRAAGNHSRAGGTEARRWRSRASPPESLPRGRDGAVPAAALVHGAGITPARAGRSPQRRPRSTRPRNHSRAGGTEASPHSSVAAITESLPRGRDGVCESEPDVV